MSKLAVANIIFETTESNRIEYTGNNVVRVRANGGLQIPFGTTAQRAPTEYGLIRYNTDLQTVEMYDAGGWYNMPTGGYVNVIYSAANATYASGNANWIATNAAYESVNSNWNVTNTVYGVANAAFAAANNVAPQVTPAFLTGNLAYTLANTVYAASNSNWTVTNALYSVANSAFAAANNVGPQIAPTYNTANAAFAAANTKFSSSGGTISGAVEITADLTVHGNTRFIDQQTLSVGDPLIYLAANNYASDVVDIGFIANYVNSTSSNVHTGLFRSAGTKEYYLFQGYDREPLNNYIDPTGNNITMAVLNSTVRTSNLILGDANAINWITSAYASINSNWTVTNTVYGVANTALQNTTGTFNGTLTVTGNVIVGTGTTTISNSTLNIANSFVVTSQSVLIPAGNTAQRPDGIAGMVRYNTSVNRLEQYNGNEWLTIDASPTIVSVSPHIVAANDISSNAQTLVITGSGFSNPPSVRFIGTNSVEYPPTTVTFDSSSQITVKFYDNDRLTGTYEPYGVRVTNPSGLASLVSSVLYINDVPTWSNASGYIANTVNLDAFSSIYIAATDPESNGITYTLEGGSFPTGLTLSANGRISGTANVVNSSYSASGVTYNATCGANDGINKVQTRVFSILHKWRDGSTAELSVPSGYHLAQNFPSKSSGYYWIKSASMPNALQMYVDMSEESGGYDFYAFDGNGTSVTYATDTHSGTSLGLDIVYARSKYHWRAMSNYVRSVLGKSGSSYQNFFKIAYGVHKTSGGGNYTGTIMRNAAYYGSGSSDHRVNDGGRWWLRDSTFGEPNGDYTAYAWFGLNAGGYTMPENYNLENIGFNDGNASYSTGAYYLVSTNAKP